MRTITTALMIAITLFCSTASATQTAPTADALQVMVQTRHENEVHTAAADSLMKAGFLKSAAERYQALEFELADEIAELHLLDPATNNSADSAQVNTQLDRALENLASVTESAQLIRVALRML